jgi:hypothetical protein
MKNSSHFALALLFLSLLVVGALPGGEIRILPQVAGTNAFTLTFDCATDAYYQIMAAGSLESGKWTVANMGFGSPSQVSWTGSFLQAIQYFRVGAAPRSAPRDEDGDGLDDVFELSHPGFDPLDSSDALRDTDSDGMPDGWEIIHGQDPSSRADMMADTDNDGFPNLYEYARGTNPTNAASRPIPTIYVDAGVGGGGSGSATNPFNTIQAALNVATNYDIIKAADGTYTGDGNRNLDYLGKPVMVMATNVPEACVIDCQGQGVGVDFRNGEDIRSVFRNLTVTHGGSGGISIVGSSPTIVGSHIEGNKSTFPYGNVNSGAGGGMTIMSGSPVISGSRIQDNSAPYGTGGGLYLVNAAPTLVNCVISGNRAAEGGGGLYAINSTPIVRNCTVADNISAKYAGGMLFDINSMPRIVNTIVWANGSTSVSGPAQIDYSCVQGGYVGTNNINVDPIFSTDYRLASNSPCINAGSLTDAPPRDVDGEPRTDSADIGADEFKDLDGDGLADVWELLYFGDLSHNGSADTDNDGLTDLDEYRNGTNPIRRDTDGDGLEDGKEIDPFHTNPRRADTDGDGLPDGWEPAHNLNPNDPADGMSDPDRDGFGNAYEYGHHTDPTDSMSAPRPTVYVDAAAAPGGNGSSNAPYRAISPALEAAGDYGIIQIAPGVYKGMGNKDLDFGGKRLMLYSREGARTCIVDCEGSGRAFFFHNSEDERSVLRGLTIRHASVGAVDCYQADPIIERCVLTRNSGVDGAGIRCDQASPTIRNCTVADNVMGFGIWCDSASAPVIQNSIIWSNRAASIQTIGADGIIWSDQPDQIVGGAPVVKYSCIQYGWSGQSNILSNPFIIPESYSLMAGSPCIDAGAEEGATWPDMDNESPRDDPGHANMGSIVDMGADEYVDTNRNSIADWWEMVYFTNVSVVASNQCDLDGLDNRAEYENGANPYLEDTDGDGLWDSWELARGMNPRRNSVADGSAMNRFWNGGFEEGTPSDAAYIPYWNGWGTNRALGGAAQAGVRSVVIWGDSLQAGFYQNIPVYYGEEIVLSGFMMTPGDTNRLTGEQAGVIVLELFETNGACISATKARLTSTDAPNVWRAFAMTNFIPPHAGYARVTLKRDNEGSGRVYFDSIFLTVSPDSDGDKIPDWWEERYFGGVTNAVASGDPDGDLLQNDVEYLNGTDPKSADTDQDGMPDDWELCHRFDPENPTDKWGDADHDNLTNFEEYQAGTDPQLADADSDGLGDYEEIELGFANLAAFNSNRTVLVARNGAQATNTFGYWAVQGASIHARERSGYLEYGLPVATGGMYVLEVEGTQHNPLTSLESFDLTAYVDSQYTGRRTLNAPHGTSSVIRFYLPRLAAGTHSARLEWNNLLPNTFLEVLAVRLVSIGGPDTNGNGVADWQDARLSEMFAMSNAPDSSLVSPVCIEGQSWFQNRMSMRSSFAPVGQTSQVVAVKHGVGYGWYADVFLSPTNCTTVEITEDNRATTYTNFVTWAELNILTNGANIVLIRKGDSLLLTARANGATAGAFGIHIVGVTNYSGPYNRSVPHRFDAAGLYTVLGGFTNNTVTNGQLTVKVVDAAFNGDPACMIGVERSWDCPRLPPEVVIEHDGGLGVTSTNLPGGGVRFHLTTGTDDPLYMVARLGANGPIMDNAKVEGIVATQPPYWRVVQSFADGSRLVEARLYLGNIPADLTVEFHIFVGGVTFDDGTIDRTITAVDFNEFGEYVYYMLQSADTLTSTCHSTLIYQEGAYIGDN